MESSGSPPHGRGKDGKFIRINESTGITPAWAGKRAARGGSSSSSWDHPRTGGEKNTTTRHRTSLLGSPPRGRGKGVAVAGVPVAAGITPAQAGKRRETSDRRNASRDHPRVGGEKHQIDFRGTVGLGSSPHRRGKAHLWIIHQIFIRITPAWAGKRSVELFLSVLSLDHPRVGGEKRLLSVEGRTTAGSPPRGRGKATDIRFCLCTERITPAWAGKSFWPADRYRHT